VADLLARLEGRDLTLWPPGNVAAHRLGWLDSPRDMIDKGPDLVRWAASVDQSRVVLLGMGGSSLGPLVLGSSAPPGGRELVVLDTTEPRTVAGTDLDDAFFLVSSKSGTTLEVQALLAHAWSLVPDPRRYAAITDPGTPLAELATERGFTCFLNDPDIGGRYSVLSHFGMVPAALVGYDVADLCERAMATDRHAAVELGVAMGQAAGAGRDKLTIVVPERFRSFGLWGEQLVAESTGKQGKGCVPVPTSEPEQGPDRHVVVVDLDRPEDLAPELLRWEVATAIAGHVLEIDPFDEPNVAESKENSARVLANLPLPSVPAEDPAGVARALADLTRPGEDYVSIQAYVPYGQDDALEDLRRRLRDSLGGMAVTAGYGPRFLHSTGQLHKGGPNRVVALQLVARTPGPSVPIPGFPYDFATLIAAQAIGDHQSLMSHGRRVLRVAVDEVGEVR
jgi:hypothetical protein